MLTTKKDTQVKMSLTGMENTQNTIGDMVVALAIKDQADEHSPAEISQIIYGQANLGMMVALLEATDSLKVALLDNVREQFGEETAQEVVNYLMMEALNGITR